MKTIRRIGAAGLLAAFVVLAGCKDGPATGEVTGTVKVDGQIPPEGSSITFIPADGKSPSAGAVIENGHYSATVPVGLAKVEIRVPRPAGQGDKVAEGPGPGGDIIKESLPDKYNDATELTFDVKRGKNQKDWDLPSQ